MTWNGDWKDVVILLLIAEHLWSWCSGRDWWFKPPCPNCHGTRTVTWRHDDKTVLTTACPECVEPIESKCWP